MGACNRQQLNQLGHENLEDIGSRIIVTPPPTKNIKTQVTYSDRKNIIVIYESTAYTFYKPFLKLQ